MTSAAPARVAQPKGPTGPLNLIKLCVGAESVEDLAGWIAERLADCRARGEPERQVHVTRMVPSRAEELRAGGSLYWVIKGEVLCRQPLLDIEPFVDGEGIGRCRLVLDPDIIRVVPRPSRPFQGWRYLKGAEAPADLAASGGGQDLPEDLQRELRQLGLL